MDSLSIGSLNATGGRTRLSGTSSGIDTEALVNAAFEARRLPAVRLETKIDKNEARIAALGDFRTMLSGLKEALDGLRNPPGLAGTAKNVFEAKSAFLTSSTAVDPTSLVGVTAGSAARPGRFDLIVDRLATAEKRLSATVASATQTLADAWNGGGSIAGTLTLGLAGGATANVAVGNAMTIYDLAAAINATTATSEVGAQVLKLADGDLRLVLSGQETGKAITAAGDPGTIAALGLGTIQAAQTAQVRIDGVSLERRSNTIDDALAGVTLELFKAAPGTTLGVSVEPSLGDVKTRIGQVVEAYNAVRDFVTARAGVGANGTVDEDAVLYGERSLRSIAAALSTEIVRAVAGVPTGSPATLRSLGITLDAASRLEVDQGKLDAALLGNLEGVRRVLEFQATTSSGDLRVYARPNGLADRDFAVAIVDANADGTPESATIDGIAATVTGGRIEGVAGTAYAGLTLFWAGTGSTVIDVATTQGVADRLYNELEDVLDGLGGELARVAQSYADQNSRYAQEVTRIEERAEAERTRLIARYTAMEQALSLTKSLLEQIRTQTDAMTADR